MGTWEISAFGNDAAADLGFEIDDAADGVEVVAILVRALTEMEEDGVVSFFRADEAVAAATLVVSLRDPSVMPSSAQAYGPQWPREDVVVPDELVDLVDRQMRRLLDARSNRWLQSAAEADDVPRARAMVERLLRPAG